MSRDTSNTAAHNNLLITFSSEIVGSRIPVSVRRTAVTTIDLPERETLRIRRRFAPPCLFSLTWSVVFLTLAIVISGLWARSYRTIDVVTLQPDDSLAVRCRSALGSISVQWSDPRVVPLQLGLHAFPMSAAQIRNDINADDPFYEKLFRLHFASAQFSFSLFYAVILALVLAAAAWVRWTRRFSLRTLLATFAFVSLALGTIVFSLRCSS